MHCTYDQQAGRFTECDGRACRCPAPDAPKCSTPGCNADAGATDGLCFWCREAQLDAEDATLFDDRVRGVRL